MSRNLQYRVVPSSWLENNGCRLDCGPYMSGAIEARELLKKIKTERLDSLTDGYAGGIYNGPQFVRNYVEDPDYGVPFLTTSTMLHADLTHLPLISAKDANSPRLNYLKIEEGMTLITCSGSIGRMVYARKDMAGCWSNQDIMKVVAAPNKISPGYLYAYLSSRFGVPLAVSGTYGAIIQHIEPHHLADLPVPRLGEVENQAHELIQDAASLRVEASLLISEQIKELEIEIAGGPVTWIYKKPQAFSVGTKRIKSCSSRLDAFHYIGFVGEAEEKCQVSLIEISNVADVLRPPIFKRVHVENGGYEFLGGSDVMTLTQLSGVTISPKTKDIEKFIIRNGQVLFQCVGQRYGIFGCPTLANRNLIGKAVSEHQIRITPHDIRDAGYVSVYLATGFGLRFLLKHSSGTSIPVLQEEGARKIQIYWPEKCRRHSISDVAEKAWENRARAVELENEARTLIERAIEEGGR